MFGLVPKSLHGQICTEKNWRGWGGGGGGGGGLTRRTVESGASIIEVGLRNAILHIKNVNGGRSAARLHV